MLLAERIWISIYYTNYDLVFTVVNIWRYQDHLLYLPTLRYKKGHRHNTEFDTTIIKASHRKSTRLSKVEYERFNSGPCLPRGIFHIRLDFIKLIIPANSAIFLLYIRITLVNKFNKISGARLIYF